MKRIAVFCGASKGHHKDHMIVAKDFGRWLADESIGLVYGGASIGVMGAVADGVLERGGEVIGVIPEAIVDLEIAHTGLSELITVENMHQRKNKMYELSNAFVAMSGGIGTLDELCEVLTWSQLGYHSKPCMILNYRGFYDALIQHFHMICQQGFLSEEHLALLQEVKSLDALQDLILKKK